jgi:hypothetical protein
MGFNNRQAIKQFRKTVFKFSQKTFSSLEFYLKMPIVELYEWIAIALEEEGGK